MTSLSPCFAQFEPESFVDGLLGIGIAGGGSSKDEGKVLASRLSEMRKERSERSKTMEKTAPAQPTGQMNLQSLKDIDFSAMEESMATENSNMELITPGAGPSRSKKSNNKKKKRKRKNKR